MKNSFLFTALLSFFFSLAGPAALDAQDYRIGFENPIGGSEVIFFQHADFSGNEYRASTSARSIPSSGKNDAYSAMVVPRGMKVTAYRQTNYGGVSVIFYPGNYPHLRGMGDAISSYKIETLPPSTTVAYFFNNYSVDGSEYMQGFASDTKTNSSGLICDDCFDLAFIPQDMAVEVYQYDQFGGKNNKQSPFINTGGGAYERYELRHHGWGDNITSVRTKSRGYVLREVIFHPGKVTKELERQIMVSKSAISATPSGGRVTRTVKAGGKYTTTITESKSLQETKGFNASTALNVKTGVPGIVDVSLTQTLQSTYSRSTTLGSSGMKAIEQSLITEVQGSAEPGCWHRFDLVVIPVVETYQVTKIYVQADENNRPRPNGLIRRVDGEVTIRMGQIGNTISTGGCNGTGMAPTVSQTLQSYQEAISSGIYNGNAGNEGDATTPPVSEGNTDDEQANADDWSDDNEDEDDWEDEDESEELTYGEATFGYDADAVAEEDAAAEYFEVSDADGQLICYLYLEDGIWYEEDAAEDLIGEYEAVESDSKVILMREIDSGQMMMLNLKSKSVTYRPSGSENYLPYGQISY